MNKLEFMKQLEYLLQDIAEEDKKDAIQYYYDYFEDAGEENESSIIQELGSPERIAAIIRADLDSLLEEGGEFSESGYSDDRYKEPKQSLSEYTQVAPTKPQGEKKDTGKNKSLYKILLIVAAVICIPAILNIFNRGARLVLSLIVSVILLFLFLGISTFAVFISGIGLFVAGIVVVFSDLLMGILFIGIGICLLGIGFLLLALSIWFYKTLVPAIVRSVKRFCTSMNQKLRTKGGEVE